MIFEKIQSVATTRGLSIAEVERRAGIGNGTISKWKTASPSVENLSKVAKVLAVDIKKLMPEGKV